MTRERDKPKPCNLRESGNRCVLYHIRCPYGGRDRDCDFYKHIIEREYVERRR